MTYPLAPTRLALHAEITDANGRVWRWDADAHYVEDRPSNITFRTQRGDGFADASVTVRRRIDRDWPDIGLLEKLRLIDEAGFIAYEGRISEFPRSSGPDGHTITVTAAGYMASAKDRTFAEIYRDADLSKWQPASAKRKANIYAGGSTITDPNVSADATTGAPALTQDGNGPWANSILIGLAQYDAGGEAFIGSLYWAFTVITGIGAADANYHVVKQLMADDVASSVDSSDTSPAGTGTGNTLVATTSTRRFAEVYTKHIIANAGAGEISVQFPSLIVYGTHSVPKQGTEPSAGLFASDCLIDLCNRFCPQLASSGVNATTYPINQLAFLDPVTPYDAFTEINRFHQWELSVWEDGVLHFEPPSALDDYDWEVRLDDPGTRVNLHGDSIEEVANGARVTFTDLTGINRTLTPLTNPDDLADASETNPANLWSIQRWVPVDIPFPTSQADALQIGRAELAEATQVKAPGEITVRRIRDRAGNFRPPYEVRAGQRVVISDHPNDSPRRVVDTTWDADGHTLSISTDNTTKRMEGLFDRIDQARRAAGLGS